MSTEPDQARALAERIARKVSAGLSTNPTQPNSPLNAEIAAVRASINDLQKRLLQLESQARGEAHNTSTHTTSAQRTFAGFVPPTHSPWLAGVNAAAAHPTEERFGIEEAVVNELVDYFQSEKTCSIDPSGKPCDHCAMCSSRGF
ncbi:MAG: hypothetical protein JWM21_1696 [Acidobacteria bacterium]|nr:hypothetical protein [Acidobacteriota bacterium]